MTNGGLYRELGSAITSVKDILRIQPDAPAVKMVCVMRCS